MPGLILAIWQARYEVVLLAVLSVVAVFTSGGMTAEHRLLLAIPFWIILMGFVFAGLLKLRLAAGFKIIIFGVAASALASGLAPSVQYIYGKTKNPFTIGSFRQGDVAVSRFLWDVVAGEQPANPPRLKRDEFNRAKGIPDPRYDTLICPREANYVLHLFLCDYDDATILSFCGGTPVVAINLKDVWSHNRKAILGYVPNDKDLKLIWESDPRTQSVIRMFHTLRDLGTEDSISFSFGKRIRTFYVINIPNKNIRRFQKRARELPNILL